MSIQLFWTIAIILAVAIPTSIASRKAVNIILCKLFPHEVIVELEGKSITLNSREDTSTYIQVMSDIRKSQSFSPETISNLNSMIQKAA
ncbi:hypothetical protein [Vibrio owensii]|uniref:hypothetical protein n=1 Tax=Vibrio owensii TaxID=696485 RepID=UPI003CC64211